MAKVGDIAYIDYLGNLQFCATEEWSSLIGEPVGVVAIPANFLPNSPEMRLIALYDVDSYGARDEEGLTVLTWSSAYPYDIPELDNYYTNGPSLNIKKNVIRSSNGKYLCSDKFPCQMNPYDWEYGWATTDGNIAPSPYKEDGSFNEQFINNTYFPVRYKLNPCTDFKGKENTDILAGIGTAYTAANAARKYKAYDGDTLEWYLPSAGELAVYFHDFNKINAAISRTNGVKMAPSFYWSSSECSNHTALFLSAFSGYLNSAKKNFSNHVRPFTHIKEF